MHLADQYCKTKEGMRLKDKQVIKCGANANGFKYFKDICNTVFIPRNNHQDHLVQSLHFTDG